MEWVVKATTQPLYPREGRGTHFIGGWVGPRNGLDGWGKSHPHRDSIPGPSGPYLVAIPTALLKKNVTKMKVYMKKHCPLPWETKTTGFYHQNFNKEWWLK